MSEDSFEIIQRAEDRLAQEWDMEAVGAEEGVFYSILSSTPPTKPLPKGTASIFISRLVVNQNLYKAFLLLILKGASLKNAAASVGVPPSHLQSWLARGNQEYADGKDTWMSRFYYDVLRAKSQARASAEMRVRATKPKDWLHNEADSKGWSVSMGATIQTEMFLEDQSDIDQEAPPGVDAHAVVEAFRTLHQIGSLPNQDSLLEQVRIQEGIPHAEP